jgi:ribonuclease HI
MKYYVDGYTRERNPSPIGGGFTITDEEGKVLIRFEVKKKGFTNNEAELLAVKFCLEKYCDTDDEISTDSMNTISWIRRGKSKARPDLGEAISSARYILDSKNVLLLWEGREENLAGIYNDEVVPKQW